MKIVHKLGYVIVSRDEDKCVQVYTEDDFKKKRKLLDTTGATEEWQSDAPGGK